MRIVITSFGFEYIERDLMASAGRARFLRPALEDVADDMIESTRIQFQSQGRRGGGSWALPSEDWEMRKVSGGNDPRILFATGRLFDSLTKRGDGEMILQITNKGIRYGSRVPYAGVHQYGDPERNIPARPFIQFVPGDLDRWSSIIARYVVDPMKRRRGTGRA